MTYQTRHKPLNLHHLAGWLLRLVPAEFLGDKPFRIEQHFRQYRDNVETPSGWRGAEAVENGTFWLLSRACYAVRFLDLATVPAAKRDDAVRLAMAGWSPYPETDHYVIPNGESVLLCAWDARDVASRVSGLGLISGQVTIVPEAAFREALDASAGQSSRLERRLDGVVGVVASGKRRTAEQWWPDLPSIGNWRNFVRAAGLEVSSTVGLPACQELGWRVTRLGYSPDNQDSTASAGEQLAVWMAAVILAVLTVWHLNDLRQIELLKGAATARLATTEKDLDAVLSARETALSLQDRAEKLAGLVTPADSIQLFAVINDVLGQNKGQASLQLADWELRGSALKFTVVASAGVPPAATTLVKAFEKVESFRDVEAKLDGTRISVSLRLTLPASQTGSAAQPNSSSGAKS